MNPAGNAGVGAIGAVGAVDRITQEILNRLAKGKVLVVWLMDESQSMEDDRNEIATRIDRVYQELGLSAAARGDALQTAVAQPELAGGVKGVIFRGRRYDTGDKLSYLQAVIMLASEREDIGPDLRAWLAAFVQGS